MLLARFRAHYPESLWRDARYRTRDQVIPFGAFWIYYAALSSAHAFARAQFAMGVAHAIGLTFGKKGEPVSEALQADLVAAYLAPGPAAE